MDKKIDGVKYIVFVVGKVVVINCGYKCVLQFVVIEVVDQEDEVEFDVYDVVVLVFLDCEVVQCQLIDFGEWMLLCICLFGKVLVFGIIFNLIFVIVMDINFLVQDLVVVIKVNESSFCYGFVVLGCFIDGLVWVCCVLGGDLLVFVEGQICEEIFIGKYLVGNVGIYVYYFDFVSFVKIVWMVGYQEVIVIGKLFIEGKISIDWVVVLIGFQVKMLCLMCICVGVGMEDFMCGEFKDGDNCIVGGFVFNGYYVCGLLMFLSCFSNQVMVLCEGCEWQLLGYIFSGFNCFLVMNIYLFKLMFGKCFNLIIIINGSECVMVLIGVYEQVMLLDILFI